VTPVLIALAIVVAVVTIFTIGRYFYRNVGEYPAQREETARPDARFHIERSVEHIRHRLAVERTATELRRMALDKRSLERRRSVEGGDR